MKFCNYEFSSDFDYFKLRPYSDAHLGHPFSDKEKLKEDLRWLDEQENHYGILNGDIMNCAIIRSVSNVYESQLTPHEELKLSKEVFGPYKEKFLAVGLGNHEARIHKKNAVNLSEMLADYLDADYYQDSIIMKIKFGSRKINSKKQVYSVYAKHGSTGSRTVGGKANRLDDMQTTVFSDVYIVSHSHQKISFPKEMKYPDMRNNKITSKKQLFVNSGAYLNYGGYGDKKDYDPTNKGAPIIKLKGAEKESSVIISV